ncbi:hypothetical protein TRIP_C90032 [Candidatus Zixiibacteriota bacterium]|nr:hypothetical protein TRIP_C90032 [candidate division Zixibacteria bacterium]
MNVGIDRLLVHINRVLCTYGPGETRHIEMVSELHGEVDYSRPPQGVGYLSDRTPVWRRAGQSKRCRNREGFDLPLTAKWGEKDHLTELNELVYLNWFRVRNRHINTKFSYYRGGNYEICLNGFAGNYFGSYDDLICKCMW